MKILALEFSSPQRSVAVLNAQTGLIGEVIDTASDYPMKPFDLIDSALNQAELEREQIEVVVVGLGPGSYTGIRVAIALAHGWQLARGVKLCGIGSAECLAIQAAREDCTGKFSVVIDAQRGEFYVGTYDNVSGSPKTVSQLRIVPLEKIQELERTGQRVIGPEVKRWFPNGHQVFPRAATLAQVASENSDSSQNERLEPIYLRATAFVKAAPPRIPG
jgi:tRNA threonylcarbamoyladenosine biosynthesis protein TsaB